MPRRLRPATGGYVYDVLNRAVGRATLFAYLREALPGLFALGEMPAVEQLPEWLPDRWLLRRANEAPPASTGAG